VRGKGGRSPWAPWALENKYGVERDYLRDGTTDKIFSDIPPDAKLEHLYRIFTELNSQLQDYLIVQAKELLKMQNRQGEQGVK
jgi:hypothetical protein